MPLTKLVEKFQPYHDVKNPDESLKKWYMLLRHLANRNKLRVLSLLYFGPDEGFAYIQIAKILSNNPNVYAHRTDTIYNKYWETIKTIKKAKLVNTKMIMDFVNHCTKVTLNTKHEFFDFTEMTIKYAAERNEILQADIRSIENDELYRIVRPEPYQFHRKTK